MFDPAGEFYVRVLISWLIWAVAFGITMSIIIINESEK